MPDESSPKEARYTIAQVARQLRMSAKTIRAYYRVGIFPQPIRPRGERGGYWLQWAVDFMQVRLDRMHEFRMPHQVRSLVDQARKQKPNRRSDRRTKLDGPEG